MEKHIYYPRTTASQREVLFETWQASKDVRGACQKARVSERTFYYWRPRFEAEGYEALQEFEPLGAKKGSRKPAEVEEKVIKMRQANQKWGKQRIADEISKENNWVPLVSPNTVKRILRDAGLWETEETESGVKKIETVSRTAEKPGQTINIDLCFVPAEHEAEVKLPAVSGSSGKLVVERPKTEPSPYPGLVFANEKLEYEEAMRQFVTASQFEKETLHAEKSLAEAKNMAMKGQKKALCQKEAELRATRGQTRQHRRQEDAAWQALKTERRAQQEKRKAPLKTGNKPPWGSKKAQDEQWTQLRQLRQKQLADRQQQDAQWRQQRRLLREQLHALPVITAWIAILVITDNCTRQCLGLPLFVAGPKVTADLVVDALQFLLPPDLQFLISDRGPQFTASIFQQLAQDKEFLHVLIARHRPQSNGIAERFVRTLKEWLADKSWQSDQQLSQLLTQFLTEFNDRPHQGLPISGLSPNEYANRLWLF